jgi:hypothetical protein
MEYRINTITGQKELVTEGKLISIGSTVKEFKNDNKTQYRVGVVQLELVHPTTGEIVVKNSFCNIYEKSVAKLVPGNKYQTTIIQMSDGSKLVTLNSGVHVEALSDDLFDFDSIEAPVANIVKAQAMMEG